MGVTTQHKRPLVYIWADGSIDNKTDVGADVVAFSYEKSLTDQRGFYAPSGRFSATLMPREVATQEAAARLTASARGYKGIHPQSIVSLGYDQPGGIMIGLVDSVTESMTFEGDIQKTLTITGRDLGKVLELDHIVRAPIVIGDFGTFYNDLRSELGDDFPLINDGFDLYTDADGNVITFKLDSLERLVTWILDRLPGMRIPVLAQAFGRDKGANGDQLRTWLSTDKSFLTWDDERLFSDMNVTPQGSVIEFIRSLLDPDFYELWVDSIPIVGSPIPQPHLILRPRPYDDVEIAPVVENPGITWTDARTLVKGRAYHDINLEDCADVTFTRSDADALSFYQVTNNWELAASDEAVVQGTAFPLVDTWSLNRYGCRAYTPQLTLVSGDPDFTKLKESGKFAEATVPVLIEKRNRLFNWYRFNPFFETGSVRVHGRDEFRIGDKVRIPWRSDPFTGTLGMEYYTTGVSQSWQSGVGFFTTLTLSRGHNSQMLRFLLQKITTESSATVPLGYTSADK